MENEEENEEEDEEEDENERPEVTARCALPPARCSPPLTPRHGWVMITPR